MIVPGSTSSGLGCSGLARVINLKEQLYQFLSIERGRTTHRGPGIKIVGGPHLKAGTRMRDPEAMPCLDSQATKNTAYKQIS
jgi:hypothetical protein